MQNDLALGLLLLLVPWERPPLFAGINCTAERYIDHCADVWELIWLSVPLHLQGVAWNIELLRKCKADAQVDRTLGKLARLPHGSRSLTATRTMTTVRTEHLTMSTTPLSPMTTV